MPSLATLSDENKQPDEKALSSVKREMAKPRLAASVREGSMPADAKFRKGELLHNRNTNEDGLAKRVYQFRGAFMYEVAVPVIRDSWAKSFYVSDWTEDVLELSQNARLKLSVRPPRDWP
jgi:hypothetical protein